MNLKYFFIIFFFVFSQFYYIQSQVTKYSPGYHPRNGDNSVISLASNEYHQRALELEGEKIAGDYVIGPEIAVTGASGFYDYQTNGECKHYIFRYSPDNLSAIYTVSTDSLDLSNSRRTVYCYSTNEGTTWEYTGQVPFGLRSGFPSMTVLGTGEAVISNHHLVFGITRGSLHIDVAPLAGTFAQYTTPYNIAWPGSSVLSNGTIMVAGSTYHNSLATDTGIVSVFNVTSFNHTTKFRVDGVDHSFMRWTYATGPGGKGLFLLDLLSDIGGNGYNRMFISFTTNNGINWSFPMQEFYTPQVLLGEIAVPYYGLDAIYDSGGNYYVAFNTQNTLDEFSSARLWVSKNGATPVLVAQHSGLNAIPEAASELISPQTGICTIDHPSLSLSSDGTVLYVAYSVAYQNDILNGFNKCHIYLSTTLTGTLQFSEPVKITNSGPGSFDERYVSISPKTPDFGGLTGKTVYMVYQKDPQPGSAAFMDIAPVSRASLVFRKISGVSYPVTGINNNSIPSKLRLLQNYPNPFNPETKIEFELDVRSSVVLSIYDMSGKLIENIFIKENIPAGKYEAIFNGGENSSGVYFARLSVKDESGRISYFSNKMLLVK